MRWKQFFTPVKSISADEGKKLIDQAGGQALTVLDVRQPREYEDGHIPGAKLIPLGEISDRISEIDANTPAVVYCAIGGRSRVAAQMLAGKGFKEVYNLTGGFKAWKSEKALGREDQGLHLFSGKESPTDTLIVAYSLEQGLREFYLSMVDKVENEDTRRLFEQLATIEVKHQDRLFAEYLKITGDSINNRDQFVEKLVTPAMEGGLTTEEYMQLYDVDLEVSAEVISLAMAIEAQALDLYQRAADRAAVEDSSQALQQIADEERAHIDQLAQLFERL